MKDSQRTIEALSESELSAVSGAGDVSPGWCHYGEFAFGDRVGDNVCMGGGAWMSLDMPLRSDVLEVEPM
jgi:hypothetical protein